MRAQCWVQAVLVALLFAPFVLAVETVHRSPQPPWGGAVNIRIACAVHDGQGNSLGRCLWTGFAVVPAGGDDVYAFEERRYVSKCALLDQADCRNVGAQKAGRQFSLTGDRSGQAEDQRERWRSDMKNLTGNLPSRNEYFKNKVENCNTATKTGTTSHFGLLNTSNPWEGIPRGGQDFIDVEIEFLKSVRDRLV